MERKLASIQKIISITPIEGADKIELCQVNNWKVVAEKGLHKVGDLVIYCEIDSFLPIHPEFEFLRKSSYKKMSDGTEGFRLKTIRLRGQLSQGLLLPHSLLSNKFNEGDDVTKYLNITKYEPPIPANLAGQMKGNFPSFIPKTDEERVQNLTKYYESYKQHQFYITEKLDGSPATFYLKDGVFGVCSRNMDLLETEGNTFWKVARELDLENKMKEYRSNVTFQGELVGPGIQKNPYGFNKHKVFLFNIFDIDRQQYETFDNLLYYSTKLNLDIVPILNHKFQLPATIDELLEMAEGKSLLNNETEREGLVIRSLDRKISFKVISNKFLLGEE